MKIKEFIESAYDERKVASDKKLAMGEGRKRRRGEMLHWESQGSRIAAHHRVSSFEFRISIFGQRSGQGGVRDRATR